MEAKYILDKAKKTLKPQPVMSLDDWFEQNITFTSGSKTGKWDRNYAPYQPGILSTISDAHYEKVVVCKSAQSGLTTTALAGYMLYCIFHQPSDICYVRPAKLQQNGA